MLCMECEGERGAAEGVVIYELVEAWLALKGFLAGMLVGVAQAGIAFGPFLCPDERLLETNAERLIEGESISVTTLNPPLSFEEVCRRLEEEASPDRKLELRDADMYDESVI